MTNTPKIQDAITTLQNNPTAREKHNAETLLFNHFMPRVFMHIHKMHRNEDEATEIASITLNKALMEIQKYEATFAFSTWVFKIAINSLIDYKRKRSFRMSSDCESIDAVFNENAEDSSMSMKDVISCNEYNPEENIIAGERADFCHALLDKIKSDTLRVMVEMRYLQQLSYKEIAKAFNAPLGTVKGNIYRAMVQLQKMV